MTALAKDCSIEAVGSGSLEVMTVASDTLRASVRVVGILSPRTSPLLLSVLGTHVRAGRRYLRVDLAQAAVDDVEVLTPLITAHGMVAGLGGMLVFDKATDEVAAVLNSGELLVSPAV
jgi:hypothetical protein